MYKICSQCGANYYTRPSRNKRFCSRRCRLIAVERGLCTYQYDFVFRLDSLIRVGECIECNQYFWKIGKTKQKRKCCSYDCVKKAQSRRLKGRKGPDALHWKGGYEKVRARRQTKEYDDWRRKVFLRDNYTCLLCDQRGYSLVAHHIKPFVEYPELGLEVGNGATLCFSCHGILEGWIRGSRMIGFLINEGLLERLKVA